MKSIYHIMVLWANALYEKDFILRDLESQFNIYKVFRVHWDKDLFLDNYTVFYAHSQKHLFYHQYRNLLKGKITHCGDGDFIAIIFRDDFPVFETRKTSSGERRVNVRVFDKKTQYRELTGGGHKVHSSDDVWETNKDLTLMFGLNTEDFIRNYSQSTEIEPYNKNCIGVGGYLSIQQLFYVLNNTIQYVVLRNYECLPDEYTVKGHGDIDLLVEDKNYITYLTLAKPVFPESYRVYHILNIAGKDVPFDFRYVGDNYYDRPWEENILMNRFFMKSLFYVPCVEDQLYSLLYHAYIQKLEIKADYIPKLSLFASSLGIEYHKEPRFAIRLLDEFMQKNDYEYIRPCDLSVIYNKSNLQLSNYALRYGNCIKRLKTSDKQNNIYESIVYEKEYSFVKRGTIKIISNELKYLTELNEYGCFPKVLWTSMEEKQGIIEISRIAGEDFSTFFGKKDHQRKRYVQSFISELLKILLILNSRKIVHRDLIPSNLLVQELNKKCQVGVIDFGWAVNQSATSSLHPNGLGMYYSNKEQASDLYTVGSVLMEQWSDVPYVNKIARLFRSKKVFDMYEQKMLIGDAEILVSHSFTFYDELRLFIRRHRILHVIKSKILKKIIQWKKYS